MEDIKLDLEIKPPDIRVLSSADAITAFFASLGYDTNSRTKQDPGNLGITAEGTLKPIKSVELIANQENLLQVYLFELTSVTVTHTRTLAQNFRNLSGNFLLVLTSDYAKIDFVLLEKFLPQRTGEVKTPTQKQSGIRPRPITVDRKNPSNVHLRVLSRFTYTETDPLYQYDKLLSAYAIADWSEEYFNNRALFSDYYLIERLPKEDTWKEADPKPAFKELSELYLGKCSEWPGKREKEMRSALYEPAFGILGFECKKGKAAESDASEPDYYLYSPGQKNKPLAACLTYPWGRYLDGKDDARDKDTPDENPGAVVVSVLERGEVPWVIVTNGKIWRLYSQKTHSKATNYYEMDLDEILTHAGKFAEGFPYFWMFFRREAFELQKVLREGQERELCFLDQILAQSEDYAKELGDRLKDRIFTKIFPHISEGFIAHIRQQEGMLAELDQDRLDEVFQGTLTLLYRLLFLLYAEARDLLPSKEVRGYYEASLGSIKKEVADIAKTIGDHAEANLKKHYKDNEYDLYDRLTKLFKVIDLGEKALNVPMYNGGLFLTNPQGDDSPELSNARFLLNHKVPDRYLAMAVDLLARDIDNKRKDLVFIDYKSLGVRQLGSIYEGLLEFKVRIADKKLGVVKVKSREVYTPFKELSDKQKTKCEKAGNTIKKGHPYLENDKKERKATGSYYTPDYIVKYIVEHAVGPVLKENFEALRPELRKAEKAYHAAVKNQKAFKAKNMKGSDPELIAKTYSHLVDKFFDCKVLDPAMGSGHFLVEAVDFICDKAIDFLNSFPWNPITVSLDQTRETILAEMEDQGITIDKHKLTDVNLLKRHVLKRAIYGVDLNPMAVELAKVSLWLHCFTLGAPLSFLDHHLKCGNSLIGVNVEEVREEIEGVGYGKKGWDDRSQTNLFGSRFAGLMLATNLMSDIGKLSDVTADQVRQSRKEFRKATDALAPFRRILDVYTSQWFGNGPESKKKGAKIPAIEFLKSNHAENFIKDPENVLEKLPKEERGIAETALEATEDKRFFHWELEFPEVFYGPRKGTTQVIERLEDAGFDAVVGNPPYINAMELNRVTDYEKPFWKIKFSSANGPYDIYIIFIEQSIRLLRLLGNTGLVTPNKYLSVPYGKSLRAFLFENACFLRLLDASRCEDAFEDPSVYPIVSLYANNYCSEQYSIIVEKTDDFSKKPEALEHESWILSVLPDNIWGLLLSDGAHILKKLLNRCVQFSSLCTINASTSTAEADNYSTIIQDDLKKNQEGWPVVNTGTIDPYNFLWGKVNFTNKGKQLIEPYLIYDSKIVSANRKKQYESPKIIFSKIAYRIEAAFDYEGKYASLNTNFAFVDGNEGFYYLGLVNSALMTWIYDQYFGALRMSGGYLQFQAPQLRVIPVIKFDPKNEVMNKVALLSRDLSQKTINDTQMEDDANKLIFQLYGLTEEEIAIVEGTKVK